jgi:hypothetical protein
MTRAAADRARGVSTLLAGFRHPVVTILLAVALATAISGKPLDGGLRALAACGLAASAGREAGNPGGPDRDSAKTVPATRTRGRTLTARRRVLVTGALAAAGAGYAVLAGSFSRFSWPATAAVAGLGTAVVLACWHHPPPHRPVRERLPTIGTALWAGTGVAGCLWELAALLQQPSLDTTSYAHPTLSALTDPVLATWAGRSAVLAAWLALGWYLARR